VNGFIDHLYTRLGTTSHYSATANSHNSQTTTASAKPFTACCVFNSSSLAMASNSGESSASRVHVVTVRRISRNWTLVDCHLNCSASSFQLSFQSSTQLSTLNWTQPAWGPRYTASGRTQQKTPPPEVTIIVTGGCIWIARISLKCLPALPSNSYCISRSLHSNGTTRWTEDGFWLHIKFNDGTYK
jgi:hypothetical protein